MVLTESHVGFLPLGKVGVWEPFFATAAMAGGCCGVGGGLDL